MGVITFGWANYTKMSLYKSDIYIINVYGVICVISLSLLKYNVYTVMYNLIKFYTGNCKLHVVLCKDLVVSNGVGV